MIKVANNLKVMLMKQAAGQAPAMSPAAQDSRFSISRPDVYGPPIASYGNTPPTSMEPTLANEILNGQPPWLSDMQYYAQQRPEDLAAASNSLARLDTRSANPERQRERYDNYARKMHNMFRASNMAQGTFDPRYARPAPMPQPSVPAPPPQFNMTPGPGGVPIASYGNTPPTSMDPLLAEEMAERVAGPRDVDGQRSSLMSNLRRESPKDIAAAVNTAGAIHARRRADFGGRDPKEKMRDMLGFHNLSRGVIDPRFLPSTL